MVLVSQFYFLSNALKLLFSVAFYAYLLSSRSSIGLKSNDWFPPQVELFTLEYLFLLFLFQKEQLLRDAPSFNQWQRTLLSLLTLPWWINRATELAYIFDRSVKIPQQWLKLVTCTNQNAVNTINQPSTST